MRYGNARAVKKLLGVFAFWRDNARENRNRCAQMRRRIVKKLQHQGVLLEHVLDDPPLHPRAASVYEPHVADPGGMSFVQVLLDHRRDVLRRERVEIEGAVDGDPQRVLILHRYRAGEDLS